jgi:hypothetical protein
LLLLTPKVSILIGKKRDLNWQGIVMLRGGFNIVKLFENVSPKLKLIPNLKNVWKVSHRKNEWGAFGAPYFYNTRKIKLLLTGLTFGTDRGSIQLAHIKL